MITKTAQKRHEILCFWRKHGFQATENYCGAKRLILYAWWKIYKESGYKIDIFNQKLVDWLLWYNTQRPHWSLRLQSPVDY